MSDQPKVQKRNADMVDLLSTDFVGRNEPNYAWRAACSAVLALPALRAFWPMSSVDYTTASRARDVAGGAYHLSDNNTVTFGYDQLAPYAEFDGTNQYLSRADGGAANWADITATETYVVAAQRGLTFGGWFYFDNAAGANNEYCINKANGGVAANIAYYIQRRDAANGGVGRAAVIGAGAAPTNLISTTTALAATQWYFLVARLVPSTSLDIYWNDENQRNLLQKNSLVAGVSPDIQDIGAAFAIGARGDAALFMDGRASLCFLCAAALSDSIIGALFQNTRKAFNV